MKKVIVIVALLMMCDIASAQFRRRQEEPLPEGFKPATTNTFISQYPAVNAETRQAMFKVHAPDAQIVHVDLAGKRHLQDLEGAGNANRL